MLLIRYSSEFTHFSCPYCGRVFSFSDWRNRTVDHIIPKSVWRNIRQSEAYAKFISHDNDKRKDCRTINDERNLIFACEDCNHNKRANIIVPSWNVYGWFRLWETDDLRLHSTYFHFWSSCIYEYVCELLKKYSVNDLEYYRCVETLRLIEKFDAEYCERYRSNHWYIDNA